LYPPFSSSPLVADHLFLCRPSSSSHLPLSSNRQSPHRSRQRHYRVFEIQSCERASFHTSEPSPTSILNRPVQLATFKLQIEVTYITSAEIQLGQNFYISASPPPRPIMEAPLSSPSLSQPSQYFQGAPSPSTSQASSYTSQPAASATQAQAPNQQQAQTQRGVGDASPFLRDFNLVAEAAKRAQMAVLMRDMEAVGL
jgi:hypothetical protein